MSAPGVHITEVLIPPVLSVAWPLVMPIIPAGCPFVIHYYFPSPGSESRWFRQIIRQQWRKRP